MRSVEEPENETDDNDAPVLATTIISLVRFGSVELKITVTVITLQLIITVLCCYVNGCCTAYELRSPALFVRRRMRQHRQRHHFIAQ